MTTLKNIAFLLLALALMFSVAACSSGSSDADYPGYAGQNTPVQGGTILHAFCWSFNTIAENMEDIAKAGFTAVQTSPISECISSSSGGGSGMGIGGPNGVWWHHYQPVSYQIGNYQLGTEEEFATMCKVAEEHGVKVIVDAVINHFTSDYSKISLEIKNIEGGAFHEAAGISSWTSRRQVTQNQLLGLWDVNTQNGLMQREVLNYLKRCVELGASGFRYDAAYHIELPDDDPEFASVFWPTILDNGAEFQYGEVLDSGGAMMYAPWLNVTDAAYGTKVNRAAAGGRLKANILDKYVVNVPVERLVVWVESHDTFCNDGETASMTPQMILYGWAVIAARDGSTALYFSRPDGSEPGLATRWGNNKVGERGNDDFMSKEVAALNHFKAAMRGQGDIFSNPTDNDRLLLIERGSLDAASSGSTGAVIINTDEKIKLDKIDVQLIADGTYTDKVSGKKFTVKDGKMSGTIEAESIVVLY